MISKQTAMDIALAYREIEQGEKLLAQIAEALSRRETPDIRDGFGRSVSGLELGVRTTGNIGQRLFDVPWSLAKPIIEVHVANHKAIIAALSEKARSEICEATEPAP